MDYLELTIKLQPRDPWADIVTAELAEAGYESFVETEDGILAYAPVSAINIDNPTNNTFLEKEHPEVNANIEFKIIPQQNWNAVWEADFQPVIVEQYLSIIAPFHDKKEHSNMIVELLPKMSFGTGHHQTTWMMAKALFELEQIPAQVLDMGTGTGVLAIIAEKLGAKHVVAVDIEDWSVENTLENAERNECLCIEALCGDIDILHGRTFGLILANINKNVLKAHMQNYSWMLEKNGILLLSGFFDTDVDELVTFAEQFGLTKMRVLNKDNWAAIELQKS
ncbi:MAG: 50S ribosomal protein L11 methyltransferase [Flavobacteriia bacterium]|jgi:ribosomal protein L11 methyltransferase